MQFNTQSGQLSTLKYDAVLVPVFIEGLGDSAKELDKACKGALSALIKSGDVTGKIQSTTWLLAPTGCAATRILLIGCGNKGAKNEADYQKICQTAWYELAKSAAKNALACFTELKITGREMNWNIRQAIEIERAMAYRFTQCKSTKPEKNSLPTLSKVTFYVEKAAEGKTASLALSQAIAQANAISAGVALARELGNLPANICTPTYLANQAKTLARKRAKLSCDVLDEAQMKKLGMGSLLSVSQGSQEPAKLIIVKYQGSARRTDKPYVLVGKGITFDSGGISLKPGPGMDEMKFDMCGAASVLGTVQACDDLKLPINVIGVIAASENLPGARATKPGDIVTSMSGQTIEILNTDAEGRLVLCDALTYCERFNPETVIDIATLTGAMVIALGAHASGLMANDNDLAADILKAGDRSYDRAWQLPLWDDYQSTLDSNFADIANIGDRTAGSITAACFLARFTKKFRWAHLDIAGTAWLSGKAKGSTGRPVPLLTQYLIDRAGKTA